MQETADSLEQSLAGATRLVEVDDFERKNEPVAQEAEATSGLQDHHRAR